MPAANSCAPARGSSNIRFTFKGLTAHAGNNPQDGRNANVAAMRLALAAYELDDKTRGTTVNPGLIHGGTGANIISDHAEVTLDLRFWNDEDGRELISKIRALAEKNWVEGVTQTVEQLSYSPAMPLSENTRALVEKITDAASEAGFDAGGSTQAAPPTAITWPRPASPSSTAAAPPAAAFTPNASSCALKPSRNAST